ncbi:MAG: MarR family transcriptional regulator [Pseudomonadota bacterium]
MSDTTEANPLILSHQFCFALYATSRAITKVYGPLLDDLGVTYPQYLVLMILWEQDGLSIQQIADRMELEGATVTPLIQRIEKLKLVQRKRCAKDGRQLQIHLTAKGRRLRDKALLVPPQLGCALGIKDKDADRMVRDLKALRNRITQS